MAKHLSFFDLDHTLLSTNGSFRFGLFLYKNRKISFFILLSLFWNYFLHILGMRDVYSIHQKSFKKLFFAKKASLFALFAKQFCEEAFSSLINERVLGVLKERIIRGDEVIIISSSPDFLVEAFARKLGVSEVYATSYCTDCEGCYLSIDRVLEGSEKKEVVNLLIHEHNLSKCETSAFSDSHLDLPFLEAVGEPIVVNPNFHLKKIAKQRGWKILL